MPRPIGIFVGLSALLVVGVLSAQVALLWAHPVAHGSTSWSFDPTTKCRQFETTDPSSRCSEVPFAPGGLVGTGFSVRNNGPLPLTIVSVASVGTESPAMLAQLDPVLPPVGQMFLPDRSRPFAPIELAAGEEATIYLVGKIRGCDAVRGNWGAGTGVRFTVARITVRWLLLSTVVELPLRDQLQVDAPAEGRCS